MGEILVVYAAYDYPMRSTIEAHLYSFARHAPYPCTYMNLALRRIPPGLDLDRFDLIIFHNTFLSRWHPSVFAKFRRHAAPLATARGIRLALPQDEFIHTDLLCDFINELNVNIVCSVAPASEWPKIYHAVDREKVRFEQVLTGYLDDATLTRIEALPTVPRDLDVGYRAWRAEAWLGRHGMLKTRLSDEVAARGPAHGLAVDCSTKAADTLFGDAWFAFLLRCKYTVGVEGGAAILDRDGTIKARTEAYVAGHPEATFDEIEAACFPGLDGTLGLFALSPRHLEACATRTCQILVEGAYNGVLMPNIHYIPLKADLSDLDEVLGTLNNEALRTAIVERAYQDVVASGRTTYRGFVETILAYAGLPGQATGPVEGTTAAWRRSRWEDRLSWMQVAMTARLKRWGRRLLPPELVARLRTAKNR